MKTKPKALVVEDDLDIKDEVEDALEVLGHDHDWAESQQAAHELVQQNHYDYVLADLEIPARTGRGFAKIEYGKKLIGQVQQAKGRGRIPVIVMTGHHMDGLNLVRELLGNGAMDFISKPFGDATKGKSLPEVIQAVLDEHRRAFPPHALPGDPPEDFRGGTLTFYPDHIELDGETILERGGPGHAWEIMQVLRKPRPNGNPTRLSAPRLAKAIDSTGQVTDGAINSCVHSLRERIAQTMLAGPNVTVSRDDVIANRGKGYHLAEWLTIEERDEIGTRVIQPSSGHQATQSGDEALTERQHWILGQLRDGVQLTRTMVEQRWDIGSRQAKRELIGLSNRGMIEFTRKPRPGHYVLRTRSGRKHAT